MKVCDHMPVGHIFLGAGLSDKKAVLDFVAGVFAGSGAATSREAVFKCMSEREDVMSTGIGGGIGIPHAACPEILRPAVALVRPAAPIDFDALDGQPVDVILAMVVPRNQRSHHLRLLAGISRLCRDSRFLKAVRAAGRPEDLCAAIREIEDSMAFH